MVRINGEDRDLAGLSLLDFLRAESYRPDRVAVERNGSIVPGKDYDITLLMNGDVLEIVSFVGGG